jgi:hypothetical protein
MNLGIGIFVGYKLCNSPIPNKPGIDYWDPNYHTDHDTSDKPISGVVTDTSGYRPIKPKKETHYKPEPKIPIQVVQCSTDSLMLILDSLKSQMIKIPITFITSFPNNPKLIEGYFSKDTLSLSLLYPNGNSSKSLFEMDYQNYRYLYSNQTLKAERIEKKPDISTDKKAYSNLFVNSGMISYTYSPFLSMNYEFHWKKLKFETSATYLMKPNIPMLSIGAGYKLK